MDAFDADVLIYAAVPDHPLGRRVAALLSSRATDGQQLAGIGSTLLLPEVLGRPTRDGAANELRALHGLLACLDLRPFDEVAAAVAVVLMATYGLRAMDACHLATAIAGRADRFITNNSKDFPATIKEIAITYPRDLPDPG